MYATGKGVPQDFQAAAHWYRTAAEQGDTRAQFNLGVLYEHGLGVPQDLVHAYMWFEIAREWGPDKDAKIARENRDRIALCMTTVQVEKAQELARHY